MKHVTYMLLAALYLLSASCGLTNRTKFSIDLKNNSNKNLYFTYSYAYPDTSVDNSIYLPTGSTRTPSVVVAPGERSNIIASKVSLDEFYAHIPSGKLQVLVYDANVAKTTPWDTVMAKYLVLKRYEITADDVSGTKGLITYP
jgi:hypothetical protein